VIAGQMEKEKNRRKFLKGEANGAKKRGNAGVSK